MLAFNMLPKMSLIMLTITFVSGCGNSSKDSEPKDNVAVPVVPDDGEVDPIEQVSLEEIQQILNTHCTGCHNSQRPAAGIDLTHPDKYMDNVEHDGALLISPGLPEKSLIYTEIEAGTMPKRADPLSAELVAKLKAWILSL